MTSIFLSYARADDEPFVRRLRDDLGAAGFDVWFDRDDLRSRGLTFHQEIREAITARERLVLVVGPKAVASEYVRQEWQFAWFDAEKVVTPILRLNGKTADGQIIDGYSLIPDELKFHCEDFRDDAQYQLQLPKLITSLRAPPPPLGKLVGVPSLPAHFLSRADRLIPLRDAVRSGLDSSAPLGGTVVRHQFYGIASSSRHVGMHGMGGIGKSVLANLLAHDRRVREAFPDGIVWVGLGSSPDMAELMRAVHRQLGGDGAFASEPEGKMRLQDILADKAVLLIIDDAWRSGDLNAFDVLGPRCRSLITTRDAGLLTALGATHHPVELLTDAEALRLLAAAIGKEVDNLPAEAQDVLKECGRLPLAVSLAGGLSLAGMPWSSLRKAFEHHKLEFFKNEHSAEPQHQNLLTAIEISVLALPVDVQTRLVELAVFPEDETVPEAAIATLWEQTGMLDALDVQQLLIQLKQRALIQVSPHQAAESHSIGRVSLHDLIHDYCVCRAQAQFGPVPGLHEKLLEAYRAKCRDGWATGPNDGYYFEHLPTHLAIAEYWSELWDLVRDPEWNLLTRWIQQGIWRQGLTCLKGLFSFHERQTANQNDQAGIATQIGRIYVVQGNIDEARQWFERALVLAPDWRGRRVRAVAQHELASLLLYKGLREQAQRSYYQALELCLLPPTIADEASANLVALATIELLEFRPNAAAAFAERSLALARDGQDAAHQIASLRIIGLSERDQLQMDSAMLRLREALRQAKASDLRYETIACANALGWLNYHIAVLDDRSTAEAKTLFLDTLQNARFTKHLAYKIEAKIGLIWCAFAEGEIVTVESLLQSMPSAENNEEVIPSNLIAAIHLAFAAISHSKRAVSDAIRRYNLTIDYCQTHSERSREADAWAGLGAIHWHRNEQTDASQCWSTAIRISDSCTLLRRKLVAATIERSKNSISAFPL